MNINNEPQVKLIAVLKKKFKELINPNRTNAIVILGVTITFGLVAGVVIGIALIALVAWGIYELVQLINGKGGTATPTTFNVIHDDAVIADSTGKVITANLTRKTDGNPVSTIDVVFEITEGPVKPGITSSMDGATTKTVATDIDGNASVLIKGIARGHDVCKVSVGLGGTSFEIPYETKEPTP